MNTLIPYITIIWLAVSTVALILSMPALFGWALFAYICAAMVDLVLGACSGESSE